MPRTITVTLGEKEHTIEELGYRKASGWLKDLEDPIQALVGPVVAVLEAPEVDLRDAAGLRNVGRALVPLLTQSVERCADALVAYAPGLREAIEEAYNDEIVEAFAEVFKLAFPFGALRRLFKPTTGPNTAPTSPS